MMTMHFRRKGAYGHVRTKAPTTQVFVGRTFPQMSWIRSAARGLRLLPKETHRRKVFSTKRQQRYVSSWWAPRLSGNALWRRNATNNFYRFSTLEQETLAVESALQRVMRIQSEARFRVYGGAVLLIGMGSWIYGNNIINFFSGNVAEVTSKSIASTEVQAEVQSLAIGAVNTVLKDEAVLAQTVVFLKQLTAQPETQVALAQLLVAALQNPATQAQVFVLSQNVVSHILNDRKTMEQVTALLGNVLQQPWMKKVVLELLQQLMEDEATRESLGKLFVSTLEEDYVVNGASNVGMSVAHNVFNDTNVADHATLWLQHVLGDDSVQQKSGEHLWNAFTYAINPFGGGRAKNIVTMPTPVAPVGTTAENNQKVEHATVVDDVVEETENAGSK